MNSTLWVALAVVALIFVLVLVMIKKMRSSMEPSWRDGEGPLEEGLSFWARIGSWFLWWI